MASITFQDLHFSYSEVPFLHDINFTVDTQDECVILYGRNGSGKSTLLNIICEFLPNDNGMHKQDTSIAFLPYNTPLFENLSGLDNLTFFYQNLRKEILSLEDPEVVKLLDILSIDYLSRKVKEYSSGERRKLALLCVLLSNANVIILDEPFTALDHISVQKFIAYINEDKKKRLYIITTHTNDLITSFAKRMLVLKDGTIVCDLLADQIQAFLDEEEANEAITKK